MTNVLLQIEGLTKRFGGLTAVHRVNLPLMDGEILGLIGPNGAGKTTLFNMISGTYRPTSGHIYLKGENITQLPPHRICKLGIARTFQIVKPFANLSVVDNVKVGAFLQTNNPRKAERNAREVVDYVGLAQYADQPAHNLTTAGRKRLELARALATGPRLMLLDEVMAGLTPTESGQMVELLRKLRTERDITLLVIEHVMTAIMSLSDRIAVLHHGELIAHGPPEKITNDQQVLEAYLGEEFNLAKR